MSKKQLWRKSGGHRIGFKIILLLVLKIVLTDMGYIEVQYTKIKSALANRSSARVTARNPAVRRQGRVCGAVAVHRYDHVGSSPAWILLLRTSLLKRLGSLASCTLPLPPFISSHGAASVTCYASPVEIGVWREGANLHQLCVCFCHNYTQTCELRWPRDWG